MLKFFDFFWNTCHLRHRQGSLCSRVHPATFFHLCCFAIPTPSLVVLVSVWLVVLNQVIVSESESCIHFFFFFSLLLLFFLLCSSSFLFIESYGFFGHVFESQVQFYVQVHVQVQVEIHFSCLLLLFWSYGLLCLECDSSSERSGFFFKAQWFL